MLYGIRYALKVLAEPFGKIYPAFWLLPVGVGAYFMAPGLAAVTGLDQPSPQKETPAPVPVPAAPLPPPVSTYVPPAPVSRPAYAPPAPAPVEAPVGEPLNILPGGGGGSGGGGRSLESSFPGFRSGYERSNGYERPNGTAGYYGQPDGRDERPNGTPEFMFGRIARPDVTMPDRPPGASMQARQTPGYAGGRAAVGGGYGGARGGGGGGGHR